MVFGPPGICSTPLEVVKSNIISYNNNTSFFFLALCYLDGTKATAGNDTSCIRSLYQPELTIKGDKGKAASQSVLVKKEIILP